MRVLEGALSAGEFRWAVAMATSVLAALMLARTAVSVYDWMLALSLRQKVHSIAPQEPDGRPRRHRPLLAIVAGTDRRAA